MVSLNFFQLFATKYNLQHLKQIKENDEKETIRLMSHGLPQQMIKHDIGEIGKITISK